VNFAQLLIEAFRSLAANRLRTALTMLGIIIGIASVVLMLAVGDAVRPGQPTEGGVRRRAGEVPTLTIDDAAAVNALPAVAAAAPVLQGFFQILYGDDNSNSTLLGTTPEIFAVRSWVMDRGVPISDNDVRSANRVIVIGERIAQDHYFRRDPLGQVLRIEGRPFTVIGVLAGTGRTLDGTDLGDMLIAPITAVPVRMPRPGLVHYISLRAKDGIGLANAEQDISELLRDRHRITGDKADDFSVVNLANIAETGNAIGAGLSVGLGVVGAISLLVGGIGIMNIMLVSVSERVREIGIRMAIGAKPWHVLAQFLSEAVVMCIVGGLVGVALAWAGAVAVNSTGKFEMSLGASHVITAVGFSTAIGLFFGWYPARRAARLLPIECLRAD
jgi:putative ABC transport system permease protein